jgi:hypothetical protein
MYSDVHLQLYLSPLFKQSPAFKQGAELHGNTIMTRYMYMLDTLNTILGILTQQNEKLVSCRMVILFWKLMTMFLNLNLFMYLKQNILQIYLRHNLDDVSRVRGGCSSPKVEVGGRKGGKCPIPKKWENLI